MTPEEASDLHARAMDTGRSWSVDELRALLEADGVFLASRAEGLVLGRVVADEAELLTIAVEAASRRRGHGRALLAEFESLAAARGARTAFLEVAEDNAAAREMYAMAGWEERGRRRGYYPRKAGPAVDALILGKPLS